MTKKCTSLVLAAMALTVCISGPVSAEVGLPTGSNVPGLVDFSVLATAYPPGTWVQTAAGSDRTSEPFTLVALPDMQRCSQISRGDGAPSPQVDCAHYQFPDGGVGPLLIHRGGLQANAFSNAPRVQIDIVTAVNFVSCMGTAEACRFTTYFLVEE